LAEHSIPQTIPQGQLHPPTPWARRLDFAACCAWLLGSTLMAGMALLGPGQDFRGYYAAARVVLAHGNPYDYQTLAPMLLSVTGALGNNPYFYAPWFAWLVIPIAWLPFPVARGMWMLFNLLVWDYSLWRLGGLFSWPKRNGQRWLLYLVATLSFAWFTWRCEQASVLLLGVLVAMVTALRQKRWIWVSIWLALFLIKPSITLLPALAILLWLVRRRTWQPVVGTGAITAGLLLAFSVVTPGWYLSLLKPGFGEGLFDRMDGPGNVGLIILARLIWKSASLLPVVVTSLLVSFGVTPYAFQYDYALLALVFIWGLAISEYGQGRWAILAGAAIAIFVVSVPIWERPISDGYWMVIGLAALAIWSWHSADEARIPAELL
jgi:hypothetical protein